MNKKIVKIKEKGKIIEIINRKINGYKTCLRKEKEEMNKALKYNLHYLASVKASLICEYLIAISVLEDLLEEMGWVKNEQNRKN